MAQWEIHIKWEDGKEEIKKAVSDIEAKQLENALHLNPKIVKITPKKKK
jgi:hypothetical protein